MMSMAEVRNCVFRSTIIQLEFHEFKSVCYHCAERLVRKASLIELGVVFAQNLSVMSDLESKDEGVNLGMEKPLTTEDMQPQNLTEEQIDLIRKEIDNGMNKSPEGVVDRVDETTESEATTKFLRSSDADFDASQLIFVNPDEGTPAAEALAGTSIMSS